MPRAMPIIMALFPAVLKTLMMYTVRFSIFSPDIQSGSQDVKYTPAKVRPSNIMKAVPNSRIASIFLARKARKAAEDI